MSLLGYLFSAAKIVIIFEIAIQICNFFRTFVLEMKLLVENDIWGFGLEAALAEISPQRREQALRYRHKLGQRQCVLAYLLLKRGLSEEFGIRENPLFEYGEHGKPQLAGYPEVFFNMSHCREAVVCAVSNRPVGVDVETIGRYKESLVRYTMNDDECQQILQAERPDVEFIRLWTMKEARLKLTGEGISSDMKTTLADAGNYHFETVIDKELRYVYTICEENEG